MRGKILIITGLAVGYVLGTRAGRERYEEIKRTATKFWNDPRVKQQIETVEDFAKDKAPEVVDFISENAKKVVSQVRSTKKSDAAMSKSGTSTSDTTTGGTSTGGTSTGETTTGGSPSTSGTESGPRSSSSLK